MFNDLYHTRQFAEDTNDLETCYIYILMRGVSTMHKVSLCSLVVLTINFKQLKKLVKAFKRSPKSSTNLLKSLTNSARKPERHMTYSGIRTDFEATLSQILRRVYYTKIYRCS
jgi:hypothetical protein